VAHIPPAAAQTAARFLIKISTKIPSGTQDYLLGFRHRRNAIASPTTTPATAAAIDTPATAPFDNPALEPGVEVPVAATLVVIVV